MVRWTKSGVIRLENYQVRLSTYTFAICQWFCRPFSKKSRITLTHIKDEKEIGLVNDVFQLFPYFPTLFKRYLTLAIKYLPNILLVRCIR